MGVGKERFFLVGGVEGEDSIGFLVEARRGEAMSKAGGLEPLGCVLTGGLVVRLELNDSVCRISWGPITVPALQCPARGRTFSIVSHHPWCPANKVILFLTLQRF